MSIKAILTSGLCALAIGGMTMAPVSVSAASPPVQKQDEWKNIAIGAGALGLLGLLKKDSTLTFVGTAGALYSLYRYEQDRKSNSRIRRLRAAYFSKPSFVRDGVLYERRLVTRNGKQYYQFVRVN
jgi:hypothetical protein